MSNDRHDHRHCLELFEKLSEYLDNELDEATCRDIEEHIKECIPCFICLQTLKRTIALCKQAGEKPIPEEFSRKLNQVFHNLPKNPPA
jgi:anti-sigma factor RsiW